MTIQAQKPHKIVRISFDSFRILKVAFDVVTKSKADKSVAIEPGIGLAYTYDKNDKALNVYLKVWLYDSPLQYKFEFVSGGRFILSDKPDEKTLENFARINCPAIMYPYVRETIADLTRRAGFKPLHLPPVNFVNLDLKLEKPALKGGKLSKR